MKIKVTSEIPHLKLEINGENCYISPKTCKIKPSNFGNLKGICKICRGEHIFEIKDSPFHEGIKDGEMEYIAVKDMEIDVTVVGRFHPNEEGNPDIANPVHDIRKADGLHLKGKDREAIARRAAQIGVKATYMEQLQYANKEQIEGGNKTSVKSIPVIKVARREQEKKEQGGQTFYEAILNVYEAQDGISPNFEDTKANRKLPGFIREVSKMSLGKIYTFIMTWLGNFDLF